ncbi:MAG TPA: hypothetical protein DCO79_10140 [Spirochaeta sp.]|nr:hypothetical protein [Spirochaeta sp.]
MIADNIIIMMCITDEATGIIQEMQKEMTPDLYLTLFSGGVGCGAPVIKLEMKPALEDDIIENISGFEIRIRPAIMKFLPDAEILVEDTFWGKKLKVKTVYGCR